MTKLYLRPIGFLYGPTAATAIAEGLALPLAGSAIAFTAAELIEGVPGDSKAHLFAVRALAESKDADLTPLMERVTAKRPPFAGFNLDRPLLMGIVNVTPDSFSDGGLYDSKEEAVVHAAGLVIAGADIVDIGGESTRPGSDTVEAQDELLRVVPVIEQLHGIKAAISIDTRKAEVARAAGKAGAAIFNDVSALTFDPDSLAVAAESGLAVILMHAKGAPKTMQDNPSYDDVVLEVFDYLAERIAAAEAGGVPRARIAADPGIGFGKSLAHNLNLLAHMSIFHGLGVPLLIGASRKRFIGAFGREGAPREREPGSQAAALTACGQGVQMLRVHDVAATRQALCVWRAGVTGAETWGNPN